LVLEIGFDVRFGLTVAGRLLAEENGFASSAESRFTSIRGRRLRWSTLKITFGK
jgi:hypothetical protein